MRSVPVVCTALAGAALGFGWVPLALLFACLVPPTAAFVRWGSASPT